MKNRMRNTILRNTILRWLWVCAASLVATTTVQAAPIAMTPDNWTLSEQGASFEQHMGRTAIKLNGGNAVLMGQSFKNGIIEFDIAMPAARGFAGLFFREREGQNAEEFYLRSHLSGMPDANQYTPVFNGLNAWQLLHGPRYSAPTDYRFDTWTHVKLVVKDNRMDVYIDSDDPVLHVDNLFHGTSEGGIRLRGAVADYYYSNVNVTPDDGVKLVGSAAPLPNLPKNLITRFAVGNRVVSSAGVEGTAALNPDLLEGQEWQWLEVGETGAADLAGLASRTREMNTQLVRMAITADKAQTLELAYGYSDRATVFLNGRAIAHGDNTYASRDYRYLGTIGLFDSVFLPLEAGENEVVIAVSEAFGGWGIMASASVPKGVSVH
ncbi:family 16 glycoside hydrolase [Kordiimonas aestuarii]|uniref:family 16 glycoside hydrolase n=1 Tax=Kordiimonas aestuarii TaxID=1005925 RepID=UPI0021D2AB8E|nr:family 16 glycoside hydrolase [Kordiimonas aestuarii]